MIFEYNITNKNYHTLDYYLKTKYNKKVIKIPLNASFTCPNRDGSKGIGGCLFCSQLGSGDFTGNPKQELTKQFKEVRANLNKDDLDAYYIVYFQAYSNTYGSIEKLKNNFEAFKDDDKVIGISIATRCDCLDKEKVDYIKSLKQYYKEVWVELGLQTANTKTMKDMNLCYNQKDFKEAVKLLHEANIDVIVHIIDGLPNETKKDMLNTIDFINKLPVKGIKIHYLNILKNTALGDRYLNKPFKLLSEEEYIEIVCEQIARLKDDIIIHRIGADSKEDDLIAPLWVRKKLSVLDKIDEKLRLENILQGDLY